MRRCLPVGWAPAQNTLLRGYGVGQVTSSRPAQDETPPEGKLHVGRDHVFLVQCRIPRGWNTVDAHQMLPRRHRGSWRGERMSRNQKGRVRAACFPGYCYFIFFWLHHHKERRWAVLMHRTASVLWAVTIVGGRREHAGTVSLPHAGSSANTSVGLGRHSQHAFS